MFKISIWITIFSNFFGEVPKLFSIFRIISYFTYNIWKNFKIILKSVLFSLYFFLKKLFFVKINK